MPPLSQNLGKSVLPPASNAVLVVKKKPALDTAGKSRMFALLISPVPPNSNNVPEDTSKPKSAALPVTS